MTLRCGLRQVSQSLVHLLAPTDENTQQRFDLAQKATPEELANEPITTIPKSAL